MTVRHRIENSVVSPASSGVITACSRLASVRLDMKKVERWSGGKWSWGKGYELGGEDDGRPHVVAVDYGSKRNIFRNLCEAGARVTIVPATASFDEVMAHNPDGFFLFVEEEAIDEMAHRNNARLTIEPRGRSSLRSGARIRVS